MADTGDLGKQAEMLAQINSLLEKRCALEANLAKSCSKQGAMAQEAAAALGQQSESLEKVGGGWSTVNQSLEEGAKKQKEVKKQSEGWLKGLLNKGKGIFGATAAVGGLVKGFKGLASVGKAVVIGLKSVVKGLFNVGKSIIKIPFKVFSGLLATANEAAEMGQVLRQAYEDVRKEFGSFAEGPAKNVIGAYKDLSKSSGDLAGTGLSVGQVFGFGPEGAAKMMQEVGGLAKALGPNLSMLGDDFKKSAGQAVMFSKGLGISAEGMAGLMKDAKLSGKSQSEMMTEIGSQSLQMAKKFGLSSKDIGRDIAAMKGDFTTFGNMSVKTMAATSAYARKLGMDMKDLKGVVDKFDDFEGAAQSVGQLNQAFGIQLDTMKMMNAENPAERIDMMRKAFFAAGKSIESMTRHEKKLLAAQTGLSESALKNAFSAENQGVAYEDFADAAQDAEDQQMSQAEVMKKLAKGIEKITKIAMKFSSIFDAIFKGFMHFMKTSPKMQKLWAQIRQMMWAFFELGQILGEFFADVLDKSGVLGALMEYFDPAPIIYFIQDIKKPLMELADWLATGKGSPDKVFEKFFNSFSTLFSQRGAAGKKVGTAMGRLGIMFSKLFGKLVEWLIPKVISMFTALWEKVSAFMQTEQGKKFMKGVTKFLVSAITGAFKLVFSAGGALLKGGLNAITGWFDKDMPNALNAAAKGTNLIAAATGIGGKIFGAVSGGPIALALAASAMSKNFDAMEKLVGSGLSDTNKTMAIGAAAMVETLTFGLMPDSISAKIGNFYGGILTKMDGFAEKVGLGTAWEGIKERVAGSIDMLKGFGDILRGLFSSDPKKLQQGLEKLFKGLVKSLVAIPKILLGLLSFLAKKVLPWVAKTLLKIAGTILLWLVTEFPKMIWNGITAIAGTVVDAFYSLFKFFTDEQYRTEMWENLKSYALNLLGGLTEGLSGAWTWMKCWLNDLWTKFKAFWGIKSNSTKMEGAGGFIVGGLMTPISNIWKKVKKAFGKAWEAITGIFSFEKFYNLGSKVWGGLKRGLGRIGHKFKKLFGKAWHLVKRIFSGSPIDSPKGAGGRLGKGISNGVARGLENLGPQMQASAIKGLDKLTVAMAQGAERVAQFFSSQFSRNIGSSMATGLLSIGYKTLKVFGLIVGRMVPMAVSTMKMLITTFKSGMKHLASAITGSPATKEMISMVSAVTGKLNFMMKLVIRNMRKLSNIIGVMGKRGMGITRFSLFSRQNKNLFYSLAHMFHNMVQALRRVRWSTVLNQLDTTTYTVSMIDKTFSALAAIDLGKFTKRAEAMNSAYLGRNGKVVSVVSDLVDTYNATYNALEDISKRPANLMVKLENFANALGMDSSTFTVENEKLNFTINVGVVIDAEKMVDTLADRAVMGERTLKTVTGFAPFE